MRLLLINAFKGLKKKKIQMFGIIIMVMLSMAVYVGMNTSIDRLEDRYYNYLEEQNVEHLAVDVAIDYTNDVTNEDIDYLLEHEFKNVTDEERQLLESYRLYIASREYDVSMFYTIKTLFQKYNANEYFETKVLEQYKDKYNYDYELERSKTISEDKKSFKVLPYTKDNKINKPYLKEGKFPENNGEVAILPGYAKANNLELGDKYKIGDKEYTIVGFAYASDYIYPLITLSVPIFDEKNNNLAFVTEDEYPNIVGIKDNSYAIYYKNNMSRKFEITVTTGPSEETTESEKDPMLAIFDTNKITMGMNTFARMGRISALQLEFASNRLFAECFLYLLLGISVLIIVIITKKRIDDERLQIGVLKSLGYNRFSIAASYLVYPVVGSIIGGLIGYIIGIIVNTPLCNILVSFYTVPLDNYSLDLSYLKTAILTPTIVLSLLSYLIAIIMLRKKPLSLLKEGSNLKINFFSRIINKFNSLFPFHYKFKFSLAFRSLGKLLIVTITSFCTGLLIVLVLVGSNLFGNMIEKTFEGMNYKYMIMLNQIDYKEDTSDQDDYILNVSIPLKEIKDKNNKIKEFDNKEEVSFSLNGIDEKTEFITILNKDKKEMNNLLKDNKIIVNENAKELYNLEIGDKLRFTHENINVEYEIIGFSSEFMGTSAYINRNYLSTSTGFKDTAYSTIYSTNSKYESYKNLTEDEEASIAYIMNFDDLKANIEKQMDRFNGSIYIVIAFASLMVLVIIAVIANIVVEENKKTISLLKVMGYKNKKISGMVLNIYTPFIIIAYLLSIPFMISILKSIVKAIVGDIGITIPISISPSLALLGLVGLLIAYYIAIYLSKRVLNKVPLAVALKRE